MTEPAVQIAIVETQAKPLRSIEVIKSVDGEKVVLQKPEDKLIRHLRPLYVKAFLDGVLVEKVLVDNGAIVNILASRTLKAIGKSVDDLLPTEVNINNFSGGSSEAREIVALQLQVGSRLMGTTFFVIDSTSNYNVLLGRDWVHLNGCVPSSLQQALIFLTGGGQNKKGMEIFWADANPFVADVNNKVVVLYDEDLGPVVIDKEEVKSLGKCLTTEGFKAFIEEGFKQIGQELAKPSLMQKQKRLVIEEIAEDDG